MEFLRSEFLPQSFQHSLRGLGPTGRRPIGAKPLTFNWFGLDCLIQSVESPLVTKSRICSQRIMCFHPKIEILMRMVCKKDARLESV